MDNGLCGQAWSLTGSTGLMAASLAANSLVFAIGAAADVSLTSAPNAPRRAPLEIEGLQMVFSVIAIGAPVAGQVLQVFKASDNAQAMPTGGTSLTALPKRTKDAGSNSGMIGDVARIATTTGLTAGTFTRGTVPIATLDLVAAGAVGSRVIFEAFEYVNGAGISLDPGEILVVSNPAALQAVMTWSLTVNIDYRRRDSL